MPGFLVAIITLPIGWRTDLARVHSLPPFSLPAPPAARFMIARRHHDHRLQKRRWRTWHAHRRPRDRARPQPTQSILPPLSLPLSVSAARSANRSAHIKGSRKHSFIRSFDGGRGAGQQRSSQATRSRAIERTNESAK